MRPTFLYPPFATIPPGSATVSVYLADRNDNAPEILYPSKTNNTIHISSLTPRGYIISKVKAYDPDAANNAKVCRLL